MRSPVSGLVSIVSLAALLSGVGGCNDAVAKAKEPSAKAPGDEGIAFSSATRPKPPPVDIVTKAPAPKVENVGALDGADALRPFYEALAKLEDGRAQDDVRIVQFGDSHTAADLETAVIRRGLVARFGDGGRGFVQLGKPWKSYVQEGVRTGMVDFSAARTTKKERLYPGSEGHLGLGGGAIASSKRGARAWADLSGRASAFELSYLQQPVGGSFELFVDGARVARVSTKGPTFESAFRAFEAPEGPHHVEVRAVGDGDVRIFGVTADAKPFGVTLDALGINGARATTLLSWNEGHAAEQLRHRAPTLVVLAYGTNESGDDATREAYERHVVDALGRVMRAAPTAACLLMGPPDRATSDGNKEVWSTLPKIVEIVESQRRIAKAARCAFYDQLAAMGGEGSIANWALEEPPRAQKDRVHLSKDGYAQLGATFVADLLRGYANFRASKGLTASPALTKPVPAVVPTHEPEGDPHAPDPH